MALSSAFSATSNRSQTRISVIHAGQQQAELEWYDMAFAVTAKRQEIAKFLVRHEIFQTFLNVPGVIIECGVNNGQGVCSWLHFSSVYEPYNYTRKIVGFDTFAGFPHLEHEDSSSHPESKVGGYSGASIESLRSIVGGHDNERPLGHIPKVELVAGDACLTIPEYFQANPQLVVACLNLDFDLYEPTAVAISTFLPRMPRGAVIVFDELNSYDWPGETVALAKTIGINNLRLQRHNFHSQIAYAVLD